MNSKFLASVVVTFVMFVGFGYLVHDIVLGWDYRDAVARGIYRQHPTELKYLSMVLLGQLVGAVAFAWIYIHGKEDKPFIAQGMRYGLAISALMVVPKFMVYFGITPISHWLMVKQIIFESIAVILTAIVVAWINTPKTKMT
jgi:hypothetical protein